MADQTGRTHISSTGLSVITTPEEPRWDIVFVHGFTGHPERTWSTKVNRGDTGHATERPSKRQKLNQTFQTLTGSSEGECTSSVFWPRDILPSTVTDARILTYGYDTHIRHRLDVPVPQSTVYDIAWDFLVALEGERRVDPSRPMIFIVHSLGGIVVKEMLRRSNGCSRGQPHLYQVFARTKGIIFFGTPHGGADPRGFLHRVAERLVKTIGFTFNKQVVTALLPSSERLKELRDEFGPLVEEHGWIIHSFQEQQGVAALGGAKVVEDTSSYLNLPAREITEHIERNHMEMCRFVGPDDAEYRKVAWALLRMTQTELEPKESAILFPRLLSDEQKMSLLDSLNFDQLDSRQSSIKSAHAKTCRWLLDTREYQDWLALKGAEEHNGFFWIKGKPGAGKSTLMKFATLTTRKRLTDTTVISHFFNARGGDLEKSILGAYRSLLLQLIQQIPRLHVVFDALHVSIRTFSPASPWTIATLEHLFSIEIEKLGNSSVICFIDALDECEEDQVRDMVLYFEHISETISRGKNFRVCLASRHYPHINIRRGLSLVLEGHEGHEQDITSYLGNQLDIGRSKLAECIRKEVQEKASGVFMWVVLVVDILNREFQRGRIHALRQKLHELPRDLHTLFRNILMRDTHDIPELVLCLQWVLYATKPLSPEELYFAILAGNKTNPTSWDPEEISMDDICRFLLNCSKGLVEVTRSRSAKTVQFIHESVRDFVLKENGLAAISACLGENFDAQSHEALKNCCLAYLKTASTQIPPSWMATLESRDRQGSDDVVCRDFLTHAKPVQQGEDWYPKTIATDWPFLEHSVQHVLHYANTAQSNGFEQTSFLATFPLETWANYANFFERARIRRYNLRSYPTLLYILAERNAIHLCQILDCVPAYLQVEKQRYGTPLVAALATEGLDVVKLFLQKQVNHQEQNECLRRHYNEYFHDGFRCGNLKRDFVYSQDASILANLAKANEYLVVQFLIKTGQLNNEIRDGSGHHLFKFALECGQNALGQQLFQQQTKDQGKGLLNYAINNKGWSFIEFMLEQDAIDQSLFRWLLSRAVPTAQARAVHLVLDNEDFDFHAFFNDDSEAPKVLISDADLIENKEMLIKMLRKGQLNKLMKEKLLSIGAMWKGNGDIYSSIGKSSWEMGGVVDLLLEQNDIDINCRDEQGRTPLMLAASFGNVEAVELLLQMEAVDLSARDKSGLTPLGCALLIPEWYIIVSSMATLSSIGANPKTFFGRDLFSVAPTSELGIQNVDFPATSKFDPANFQDHLRLLYLFHECRRYDINSQDEDGQSALLRACMFYPDTDYSEKHRCVAVKYMLQIDTIEPDMADDCGRTPLSWAAESGFLEVARLLIVTGKVNATSKDKSGKTPLCYAIQNRQTLMIGFLEWQTGNAAHIV